MFLLLTNLQLHVLSLAHLQSQVDIYCPKWLLFALLLFLSFFILSCILLYSHSFPVMTHIDAGKYPFIFYAPSLIQFLFIS